MTTLAPKLPYSHPFSGGYPRIGGQPLPTDPDAIDYLERVKAADGGAAVEVGVAMAVDAFVKGCKADSAGYAGDPTRTVWDALQACCIMAGARTISGALVPLKGAAPTAEGAWASGDYDRATGLKGNGSSLYLTAGVGYNEIATSDEHLSVYASVAAGDPENLIGGGTVSPASYSRIGFFTNQQRYDMQSLTAGASIGVPSATGFIGASRSEASSFDYRYGGNSYGIARTAATRSTTTTPYGVFCGNYSDIAAAAPSSARLAFYSIGSSLDLSALDNRVSTLISSISTALS